MNFFFVCWGKREKMFVCPYIIYKAHQTVLHHVIAGGT